MTDRDVDAAVEQLRETAICMRGDRKRGDPNDAYSALADEMDLACDALAEARQEIAAQAQEFHKLTGQNELRKKQMARFPFCSDHRDKVLGRPCRECEREKAERRLVAQAQEIARLTEQIDAMRGEDLGGLEHVEYCEDCQRFFDSREGCPTDIRADEREKAEQEIQAKAGR